MKPASTSRARAAHASRHDVDRWRLKPLARALAVMLAAGGAMDGAQAQQALGAAWFANKNVMQNTALATGRLPNGMPASSLTNPMAQQQRDSAQLQRSIDNLNLAARGIAAQQAAQEAARLAALGGASGIPDGLAEGGLKVDTQSLTAGWLNARAPVQTAAGGRTVVGIEQTAEKAILNWESFNVGKNTTVQFDQKGGAKPDGSNGWIALNRINDPSGRPSQIAGQIKADGSVYLVNRNGIVFTGSSQVNTRTLVASSLALSDKQFNLGINKPQVYKDASGQADDFAIPQFGDFAARAPGLYGFEAGSGGAPDKLGGVDRFVPGAAPGAVQVQAGAQLRTTPGGKLMLFAPKVSNAGALFAPDGQVILAAGENIYLNAAKGNDTNGVRGLDVAASAVPGWAFAWTHLENALRDGTDPYTPAYTEALAKIVLPEMTARAAAVGYDVTNSGIVLSERGNVTLQARDIHQDGVVASTTALGNRNGSILLRAWGQGTHAYQNSDTHDVLLSWQAGTLTLGKGSVTQVLPDVTDTSEIETTALATRYRPGWIGLYGQLIEARPGAGVLVPSGSINIESAVNPLSTQLPYFKPDSLRDGSRIYLDRGAYLSVAGLQGRIVPMSRNFVEAELRINELRDSPLLIESWVRGKKVIVDRRVSGVFEGGPMAGVEWVKNATGGYIPGAWAGTPLGDVTGWVGVGKTDLKELSADAGSIKLRAGGSVITREGSLIDVSGGSVRYLDGMNTVTKLMGADGRVYTMDRAMPDGEYTGLAGRYTNAHARWGVSNTWRSPVIGRDAVEAGYIEGRKAGTVQIFAGDAMVLEGDYAGGVVVGERQRKQPSKNVGGQLQLGGGSTEDRPWSPNRVVISHEPHRLAAEFHAGSVLDRNYEAQPEPGAPSNATGKVTFLSDDVLSRSGMGKLVFNLAGNFGFVLESGAVVELSPGASFVAGGGDGSANPMQIDGTLRAAGGNISLSAINGTLRMGATGRLDASGQWINAWRDGMAPARWAMDGGTINLGVGKLLAEPGAVLDVSGGGRVDINKKNLPSLRVGDAGSLTLSGLTAATDLSGFDIRAHAAGSAGRLVLETRSPVQIGGEAATPEVLVLPATLYGDRGFGDVSVVASATADGRITVPKGVTVAPSVSSIDLRTFAYQDIATGDSLAARAPVGTLRLEERLKRAPAAIRLNVTAGSIDIGAGATLRTDVGGTLAMTAAGGSLTVNGALDAPAGRIDLAAKEITLASGASLTARGVAAIYPEAMGNRVGQVLRGGDVVLGNGVSGATLSLDPGALIDVSGTSGEVDELTYKRFSGPSFHAVTRDSDGGSIRIFGAGKVGADMRGHAGGATAAGGALTIVDVGGADGAPVKLPSRTYFWRDPVTGKIKSANSYLSIPNLDLYNEYGTTPIKFTQDMRAAILDLTTSIGTGMEVVTDLNAPGSARSIKPWEMDPFIEQPVVELLNRYFYSDAAATKHIVIPDTQMAPTMRIASGSLGRGGFGAVSLKSNTITLGDGVKIDVRGALNLSGTLTNGGNRGSAQLSASRLTLDAVSPYTAKPWSDPASLGGALTLSAGLLEVRREALGGAAGARIAGFGTTVMAADEIRFGGALPEQITANSSLRVGLDVDGQLVLKAGQVYPATATTAAVRAGQSITVERLRDAGSVPLSAGGTLRLEAPVIEQNGVLRAPHGAIELNATDRLALGAGSITSVSGKGVVVPYGILTNDEHWHDPTQPLNSLTPFVGSLTAPPEKRITMKSPNVDLAKGAVVDIAGGGDLYAWEFVPGPGGSHDVLTTRGMYAVLPGHSSAAPSSAMPAGERVWLAGGGGLAAGWYTLLPARYAMLPGAFAVQATGTAWAGPAAGGVSTRDGSIVMQGKAGNAYSGKQDAVPSAWRVMSDGTLRKYTEYNEAFANDFFSSDAFRLTQYRMTGQDVVTPRLPRDGGWVVFDATRRLTLDGTLRSQADAGGRGGLVDIAGQKIAIVGAGHDGTALQADGYLVIDATSLSNFGAGSLLVGGTRTGDPRGMRVNVTATDIVVRNDEGSELFGPEIVLAATGKVAVDAGSRVSAKGVRSSRTGNLIVTPQVAAVYTDPDGNLDDNNDGVIDAKDAVDDVLITPARDWGALIRVATGDAVKALRQNVDITQGGLVRIGEGAVLRGDASLLIDATRTTELAGSARISGTDLSVSSGRIGFGGGTEGMVLDSTGLAQLAQSTRLTLRSYSSFDFYRSMDMGAAGLASLTFDGAAFTGRGAGDIAIRGDAITLLNTLGDAGGTSAGAGTGRFTLDASTLVLGAGQKRFTGFGAVALAGREQIVGEGSGGVDAGVSALTLRTPLLTGRGGAAQSVATQGALEVVGDGAARTAVSNQNLQDSLGARLSLSGGSVLLGTRAVALGGTVDISATRGSLVVADGGQIDVGGFAKQFFDVAEYADAGRINLSAVGGDVRLNAGSLLNLAAHPAGGSAGTLSLVAANGGTVVLDGGIAAQAGGSAGTRGKAGSFSLDIATLPDFAGFSRRLNDAGFNRSRQFRIRQGDIVLDGITMVEDFGLTADQGKVDVTGTVDARAAYGGAIRITGGNGVAMQGGAQLLAGATGPLGSGRVTLEAAGGQLDIRGGLIDVSGGDAGAVRLRAPRNADQSDLAVANLRASVTGARSAVLEGVRVYESDTVDAVKAQAIAEAGDFMAHAGAIRARLGTGMAVMPGIEIRSAGDLTLASDWNLWRDFAPAREGSLTLRAGGNLLVNGHLSDGFDAADRTGVLQEGPSWNLRLVAGGDMASANALALKPLAAQASGQGSIVVGTANTAVATEDDPHLDNGAGKLIRTGTGDLEVRAGRDLRLAHKESVIYTAGRKDTSTWSDFSTARPDATYGIAGGNLDIDAQGSIVAQPSGQRFVQWLNRQGNLSADRVFGEYVTDYIYVDGVLTPVVQRAQQSSWWVDYGQFQQGVAAFGGGNVTVRAGGDLGNLVVALTSNMRMRGGRTQAEAMTMETRNGGAMTVDAGGAIRGGQYYVGRGTAEITAGETTSGFDLTISKPDKKTQVLPIAPVLALGDATLSLRTAGDLRLQAVIDPLLVRYGDGYDALTGHVVDYGAYMSGYTDRTSLRLASTGGNITLVNQAAFAFRDLALARASTDLDGLVGRGGNRYPALTRATAMNGSLEIQGPMYVMPGTTNDVRLMAQQDVRFSNPNWRTAMDFGQSYEFNSLYKSEPFAEVIMARATPAMMPSPYVPLGGLFTVNLDALLRNEMGDPDIATNQREYYRGLGNLRTMALADDREPSRIYAARGSIIGADVMASEQTWLRAGKDIRNMRIDARNLRPSDVTLLEAGNDILAVAPVRSPYGPGVLDTGAMSVQGPGTLLLSAGRDVYADNLQVRTLGNQGYDTANRPIDETRIKGLPDQGATITVMAGMNRPAAYDAFVAAYLDPAKVAAMPDYLKTRGADGTVLPVYLTDLTQTRAGGQVKTVRRGLVSYMKDMTGETLAPMEAWSRFQALPALAQQQFIRQIYLIELRDAGRDQNEPGSNDLPRNGGVNRGYAAVETLFPGDAWKGDVAANTLMLRTMAGGDIDVLTPGGGLQVAALGATVPDGYGLVTLGSGHIGIFTRDDVTVNRSRILSFVPEATTRGSDQIIWSSKGDIDAGKGSKTVRVPSAPEVLTDPDGVTVVREKSDMSGSGIGTVGDGDVDLVAPRGIINAGDAGVRVAGNLNLIATQVLNADNIQVKGESKGIPVAAAVNIGALTTASAAASQAAMAAQEAVQRERSAARQAMPSVFTVRVLGFGSEPLPAEHKGGSESLPPAGGLQRSVRYDPDSAFQVLGQGTLTPAQRARLTETEQRRLPR
ncbi:filamentous haemagglutinin family protein [Variovorax sp. PAMC26660]|uniref:filamentous haemagglutinin family protein n=1 Tax=Variovorax sp. PAMC26660 TaxID=2762322 RepID=UPI00164E7A59|nr:filamentous haemagglutinin family protein [Variovorax sp. PAMC26660]QNK65733.1 filamentous hemagglutinin family protein [Variovorax sp. PAMC26660]